RQSSGLPPGSASPSHEPDALPVGAFEHGPAPTVAVFQPVEGQVRGGVAWHRNSPEVFHPITQLNPNSILDVPKQGRCMHGIPSIFTIASIILAKRIAQEISTGHALIESHALDRERCQSAPTKPGIEITFLPIIH